MSYVRIGIALLVLVLGLSYWLGRDRSNAVSADAPTVVAPTTSSAAGSAAAAAPSPSVVPVAHTLPTAPLAAGEHWEDLTMPGGTYVPQAENGGTDDYRCIILDPKFTADTFITGVVLEPGNGSLVHHAILYRADPDQVADATALDNQDPRLGWSCFGGTGLSAKGGIGASLESAPWVAAFATKGGESRFAQGTGQLMKKGSRLILQMHYNLLNGDGPDYTRVRLRVAPAGAQLKQIQTMLLPAPVELACPAGVTGPLCNRMNSVLDVISRFGSESGMVVAGLHYLCGSDPNDVKPSLTESCTRPVQKTMQIGAIAGHMHMLGKAISIDLIRADGSTQRLLDVKQWDFDDQRATRLAAPVTVGPGDSLKVTCTHDPTLRQKIPSLAKLQPRYVVWGEGSSDEMCLGIVSWVAP
jgi:hypothetical protein